MLNIKFQKYGKPYGNLTVEDFTDSYNFIFFSDDYLKYKKFFEEGWFLKILQRKNVKINGIILTKKNIK